MSNHYLFIISNTVIQIMLVTSYKVHSDVHVAKQADCALRWLIIACRVRYRFLHYLIHIMTLIFNQNTFKEKHLRRLAVRNTKWTIFSSHFLKPCSMLSVYTSVVQSVCCSTFVVIETFYQNLHKYLTQIQHFHFRVEIDQSLCSCVCKQIEIKSSSYLPE